MNTSVQFNGSIVPVGSSGTVNKNTLWLFTNITNFLINTNDVVFSSLGVLGSNKTVQTLSVVSSAITWDVSQGLNAQITFPVSGSTPPYALSFMNLPTGPPIGIYGTLVITQPGSGTIGSISLPSGGHHWVVGGGAGIPLLSTNFNAVDIITFYYDGTNFWWTYAPNFTHA